MTFMTDTDLKPILSDKLTETDKNKLILSPFAENCMTPVGYDLRVGRTYTTSELGKVIKDLKDGEAITLQPSTTALISTLEYIRMPKDKTISGLIESKVSQVSRGLSHVSTTIDPDWEGHLLIVIHNHSINAVTLQVGNPFCTAVFFHNLSPATRNSNHPEDRKDIYLGYMNQFSDRSVKALKIRKIKDIIPPSIVIFFGIIGYFSFGNQPGFIASVGVGVAVSQFVERKYLR